MALPSADSDLDPVAPAKEDSQAEVSPAGISAFVAKVLDQLTLSAWLPAAVFAASVALLLQFRRQGSANIAEAVRRLTDDPVRVLVLIVPVLVITTVVTQAFSFEAIRTLEGYWHRRGLASLARTLMIRRHVWRKESLIRRRLKATEKAFYAAEPGMLRRGIPMQVVCALKAAAFELDELPHLTEREFEEYDRLDWIDLCDAWHLARIEHLSEAEESYPVKARVLPTRLGNLIRATEDNLLNTNGDLQGFVLQRYALAPRRVQMQHDQFRNRLEMYCILVFVGLLLAGLSAAALAGSRIGAITIAAIAACYLALSCTSYLAAVASAGGYCAALRQMNQGPADRTHVDSASGG